MKKIYRNIGICVTSLVFTSQCKTVSNSDRQSSIKEATNTYEGMSFNISGNYNAGTSGLALGAKIEYISTNCHESVSSDGVSVKTPQNLIIVSDVTNINGAFKAIIPLNVSQRSLFFKKCDFKIASTEHNPTLIIVSPSTLKALKGNPRGAISRSKILIDSVDVEDLPASQSIECNYSNQSTDCSGSKILINRNNFSAKNVTITIK